MSVDELNSSKTNIRDLTCMVEKTKFRSNPGVRVNAVVTLKCVDHCGSTVGKGDALWLLQLRDEGSGIERD